MQRRFATYQNSIHLFDLDGQAALEGGDFEMACASLQKQNAVLATVMTDLQSHFPETDWMKLRLMTTKMLKKDYCFAGGMLMP